MEMLQNVVYQDVQTRGHRLKDQAQSSVSTYWNKVYVKRGRRSCYIFFGKHTQKANKTSVDW